MGAMKALLALLLFATSVQADPPAKVKLTLEDSRLLRGELLADTLTVETRYGKLTIPAAEVCMWKIRATAESTAACVHSIGKNSQCHAFRGGTMGFHIPQQYPKGDTGGQKSPFNWRPDVFSVAVGVGNGLRAGRRPAQMARFCVTGNPNNP